MSIRNPSRPRRSCAAIPCLLAASMLAMPLAAHAHAVLDPATAAAGSYHKLVVRIAHGCEGSPTVAVSVDLPPGIAGGKPQPKPGWQVAIQREALPQPVADGHGKMATDRVARIVWSGGRLDDAHFDEFAIQVRLPDRPGEILRFPVVQRCEAGELRWVDVPEPGARAAKLKAPAPALLLSPRR